MGADVLLFVAVGFLAQLVDGALGMAFGVICSSFLLGWGLPPAAISASVHAAEVFTTGTSGLSHLYHRNIDRYLFLRLTVAGVIGGVTGAYLLTRLPGDIMRPIVSTYLVLMGLLILYKALRGIAAEDRAHRVVPLGLGGGFLDAIGGGGWGAMVTTTLIARGKTPRIAIGSVNAAEFFVTVAVSITFILSLGGLVQHFEVILGLLFGGVMAAPMAGYLTKRVPARALMTAVALVVIATSALTIWRSVA